MNQTPPKQEPSISNNSGSSSVGAPEVKEELSKVAANPKKNILVFAAMAVGFVVMAYNLLAPQFFSPPPDDGEEKVAKPDNIVKPSAATNSAPPIPKLPEPPKLVTPTPPKPEAAAQTKKDEIPSLPSMLDPTVQKNTQPVQQAPQPFQDASAPPVGANLGGAQSEEAMKRLNAKRKAPIHLMGGGKGGPGGDVPEAEVQQSADFKKRGNLSFVLGKGKIIDVVTETAINSDFPGEVRALVTRDVFSENAKVILIPKGTRVFGDFSLSSAGGYGRISIKWSRIDLQTGYTINLAGDAVDHLGRKGVQGVVDNKYTEQMANAVLSSAFSIGVAAGIDKVIPPVQSTQSASNINYSVSIQNTAIGIYNDALAKNSMTTSSGETVVINNMCSQVQNIITDKSAPAYTQIVQACTTAAQTANNAPPGERAKALLSAITNAATTIAAANSIAAVPSHKQEAAQQAFKDLSETMKGMVKQLPTTPTTTIDQGHPIKIYVNKDYLFPKDAIIKSKVLQ